MKKTIIIALICLTTVTSHFAQQGWSIGILFNPSYYQLYNKSDFSADPRVLYPVSPNEPNSYTFGAEVGYNFTDNIGVKSGLNYSTNLQRYGANHLVAYASQLNYLQLPILFTISTPRSEDNDNKFALLGEVGVVNSYLVGYKETLETGLENSNSYSRWKDDNGMVVSHTVNPNFERTDSYKSDWIYNRFDFNLYVALGMRYFIKDNISIDFKFNAQYGLIDLDNRGAVFYIDGKMYSRWDPLIETKYALEYIATNRTLNDRPSSHNEKVGAILSLTYFFSE
jgi:hypothetical protein